MFSINSNNEIMYKLLKYLIQGTIIYLFFKFVPKDPISDNEILLIASAIILAYAISENTFNLFYPTASNTNVSCDTTCNIKEQMTSLSQQTTQESNVLSKISELDQKLKQLESDRKAFEEQMSIASTQSVNSNQPSSKSDVLMQGIVKNNNGSYTITPVINESNKAIGSRSTDGVLDAKKEFALASNYTDFTVFPPANDMFIEGSSYLPPSQWYPVPPRPPVCVTEKVCPVCPIYTEGTNVSLQEWDNSRRITPPDNINVNFITEKLNSGK